MGLPEEVPNIEQFPFSPRMAVGANRNKGNEGNPSPQELRRRCLTPARGGAVEFWNQGEQPSNVEPKALAKRGNHAKRADQLGLLFAIVALIVLTVTVISLTMANKKYSFKGHEDSANNPMIKSYQGNDAFMKKVKQERDAKSGLSQPETILVQGANEDMQIPLKDQMATMNEKLDSMRSQKLREEPLSAPSDKESTPNSMNTLLPTDLNNFNAPQELSGMLPKSIETGQ